MRAVSRHGLAAMDFAYLLLLFALFGTVYGFLLVCDRLRVRQ